MPAVSDPEFYVYMFLDTRFPGLWPAGCFCFDYRPLYVGKGRGVRVFEHLRQNAPAKQCSPILKAVLAKIRNAGFPIKAIIIRCSLTEDQAFALESRLIEIIGRRCDRSGPLANLTLGGEGAAGRKRPECERQSISNKLKGRPKPPGFGAALSKSRKGIKLSNEHRLKLSESHKGYKATAAQRAKLTAARKAEWASGKRKPVFGTPQHCALLSKLYKGRKLSEETKRKVSESLKRAYAEGRR